MKKNKIDSRAFISSSDEDEGPVERKDGKQLMGGIKLTQAGFTSSDKAVGERREDQRIERPAVARDDGTKELED